MQVIETNANIYIVYHKYAYSAMIAREKVEKGKIWQYYIRLI